MLVGQLTLNHGQNTLVNSTYIGSESNLRNMKEMQAEGIETGSSHKFKYPIQEAYLPKDNYQQPCHNHAGIV